VGRETGKYFCPCVKVSLTRDFLRISFPLAPEYPIGGNFKVMKKPEVENLVSDFLKLGMGVGSYFLSMLAWEREE
jgi:hypothetical protein